MPDTIGTLLVHSAQKHATRTALMEAGTTLTYERTLDLATACAVRLRERGIAPGDRVGILLANGWDYAVSYFGAQLAGAIVVLVNARLSAPEIAYVLADSGASLTITDDSFTDRLPAGAATVDATELVAEPGERRSPTSLPGLLRNTDDTAHLLYTSGTTGRPKGAAQTHANLLFNAGTVREQFQLTPDDRTLIVAPMFHATGINSQLIGFLSAGASCVVASAYKTADTLHTVAKQRITVFAGVATMLQLMLDRPELDSLDLSALRLFIMGGSPVPESLPKHARTKLPHTELANVWGLTEATSIVTFVRGDEYLARPWSAGRAVPGVELGIATDHDDITTNTDRVGELCVRGPIVTAGYWNKPDATAETFRDGWLHTGDIGTIDTDGYAHVLDRIKDMIIRGGENIYSLEVESVLAAHPAVADVGVVGVPDRIFGERVRAVLVLDSGYTLTATELHEYASQHLADYKVPAEFVFVTELPRNPSGKLLKRSLTQLPTAHDAT
ncbi:long-chain fatty acid--CoA ligase [Amycolatopsis ultiminotia]|uniref:Long-chain fatty acid--CoA ligase n=1 Tax=Amycolatopsis ultiminotia TaxID=543629 RepID=A0ABP6X539_9PSEU